MTDPNYHLNQPPPLPSSWATPTPVTQANQWGPPPPPPPVLQPSWAGPSVPPVQSKRSHKGLIIFAVLALLALGAVGAVTLISKATTASASGYNSSDTTELEASIFETYNAPETMDGTLSDVSCIKSGSHVFSCLLTDDGGDTAHHTVTVNAAGDEWVTGS